MSARERDWREVGKKSKRTPPQKRRRNGGKGKKKLFGKGVDPAVGKATQIQPGEVKNPGGRPKTKPITDAILAQLDEQPKLLREIALNLLRRAKKNDHSVEIVRDTIQGKPTQAISGPDGDPIPVSVEGIDEALMKLISAAQERQAKAK